MSYQLINNKEAFEKAYAYDSKPDKYPTSYPCFLRIEDEERGIMGSAWVHYVIYPPKGKPDSFYDGFYAALNAQPKHLTGG